jgi:hypothetical protein
MEPPIPPSRSPAGASPGRKKLLWIAAAVVALVVLGAVALATGNSDDDTASDRTATTEDGDADGSTGGGSGAGGDQERAVERTGSSDPDDPQTYGDDATLDDLWDACEAGDLEACDELFRESGFATGYEKFGGTCGGRTEPSGYCAARDASGGDAVTRDGGGAPVDHIDSSSEAYGDDDDLDELWDSCERGDFADCDALYANSPFGSAYEEFGATCGHRNGAQGSCKESFG